MSVVGLVMFVVALVAIVATGLPVYAVLLAVSAFFAALGVAVGAFDAALLGALPFRLVGLLEHDLLQALPLYALIGALLNRLPLAATLHRAGCRLLRRTPAAPELSALGVAALLAPMNGSVGASLHTLSRAVAPALLAHSATPARGVATLCVAGTLGVVIPPSLVLLLSATR
jgi:TRAP-type mannitol/chloroaromatic compound transport system permease large subunit